MSDHTLGPRRAVSGPDKRHPWAWVHPGCGFVLGPDNETVVGRFPKYADAVLDAAAPDLLAAASFMIAHVGTVSHNQWMEAVSRLEAAVAKAEGR
jgi:hypothetical protein